MRRNVPRRCLFRIFTAFSLYSLLYFAAPVDAYADGWVAISSGYMHPVAIKSDGTLWAWGSNAYGVLGDGTTDDKQTPTQIGSDRNWTAVATGVSHTVALKADGTLWTWGHNYYGQLGDGTTDDRQTPARVGTDTNWIAIAAGYYHTVALKADGTLWTWGCNYEYQLGDGTYYHKYAPTQIGTDTNWTAITAGVYHTVALKADGTLWAWGYNGYGQLGDGTTISKTTPTEIGTDTNWTAVTTGGYYTFALKADGTLWAWGENSYHGQLGDGTRTEKHVPTQIGTDAKWTAISAGYDHTVALKADGTLWAWGNNDCGQLGDGSTDDKQIPTPIGSDRNWTAVTASGWNYTVALKADGTLWTWGSNGNGMYLGDGTEENRSTPTRVGTAVVSADFRKVKVGANHTVAIKSDGTLWSWGRNDWGQLGDGTTTDKPYAIQIGSDTKWATVSTYYSNNLAIKTDGTLWAWGENRYGQLGDGTTSWMRTLPQQVGSDTNWTAVSAGYYHTVALKADGTLWAWGNNDWGKLGDGSTTEKIVPTKIGTETNWTSVGAGFYHTLALKADGTLWAWGMIKIGDTGTGVQYSPTQVGTDSNWIAIATWDFVIFALKSDGTLWTWGCYEGVPIQVGTDKNWAAVNVAFALKSDGTLWELGWICRTSSSLQYTLTQVGSDRNWTAAAAISHKIALKADGTLWAWGSNEYGQLGDGTTTNKSSPVQHDTEAPTGSLTISDSAIYTNTATVNLSLSASDTNGILQMSFSNDNSAWSSPEQYSSSKSWTLSSGDGTKTVYAKFMDYSGNWSSIYSTTITLDTTPPVAIISGTPPTRTNATSANLIINGIDVVAYRYSLDGNPYSEEVPITTPISLSSLTDGVHAVSVIGRDIARNWQPTGSATTASWNVDTVPSLLSITLPANNAHVSGLYFIRGTVNDTDPSSGIDHIELQVKEDGADNYLLGNGEWTTAPTFFTVSGGIIGNDWSHTTLVNTWPMGKTYTITARAFDKAGNASNITSIFTVVPAQRYATDLKMELSSQAVRLTDTIDVTGKLSSFTGSDPPVLLKGMDIVLTIQKLSDGSTLTPITTKTYDDLGYFEFRGVSFPASGGYELKISITDNLFLFGSQSVVQTVLVGTSAGYAILVQGKISSGEGLPEHNKTANSIYQKLRDRGFDDNVNIKYFNSYNTGQTGVDGAPSWTAIRTAVREWARDQMNSSPAPLYIILVDHGTQEGNFHIYPDVIRPSDLADWLKDLEDALVGAEARSQKIVVVIGSCYSGNFIPILKKEGSNRIIVTSAAQDEQSYRGPVENDGIRNGEYFLEEFFSQFARGYSLKKSFQNATDKMRLYTRRDATASNTPNPYFDNAIQHPMLDDNGDGKGSNVLSDALGDGFNSRSFFFGIGPTYITNGPNNPADIATVTDTLYLSPATVGEKLWLRVTPGTTASAAWLEIRSPSMALQGTGGETQLTTGFDRTLLWYNGTLQRWEKQNGGYFYFYESGRYEVFYHVRDLSTGKVSPMHRSVVYRNTDTNTPPDSFSLRAPENDSTPKTSLVFRWYPSSDQHGVTYNLVIATDNEFNNVVYRREEIPVPVTYVDNTIVVKDPTPENPMNMRLGLKDNTDYYWKVEAVDGYGAITVSKDGNGNPQVWHFHTDNTNGYPGILTGIIYTDQNFAGITSAVVQATVNSTSLANITSDQGQFALAATYQGEVTLTASAPGYYSTTINGVSVQPGETTKVYIPMTAKMLGDMNRDNVVSLDDAIIALKVVSGVPLPPSVSINKEADVSGDNKIGLAEVIYIMQKVAGLRQP